MKSYFTLLITVFCLLLTGCATTIRSDVSVFHAWPSDLADKSFTFETAPSHQTNPEYAAYQDQVRSELGRWGFTEAKAADAAKLKIDMRYGTTPVEVRVLQPAAIDPFWTGPDPFWRHYRWSRPGWGRYGYYGYYYDPFWYGPAMTYRESTEIRYQHQLQITISQIADGKKLYEVTVDNFSSRSTPFNTVMPYMIKSAFAEFPGKSGVTHHVDYKMEK